MTRYFVMRVLVILPTLFVVVFLTFLLGYLGPIDPVDIRRRQLLGQGILLSDEEAARLRHVYGLDRPFIVQFGHYISNLAKGQFGFSYYEPTPVWDRIKVTLPVSGSLALGGLTVLVVFGIPLGMLAGPELRHLRYELHQKFDERWLKAANKRRARRKAYDWLAKKLELQEHECHIGLFDEAQCHKALKMLEEDDQRV